jgi:hypothetical protein
MAIAVIDQPHEAGLAMGQDQLGLGQLTALLKKALRPAIQRFSRSFLTSHCAIVGGFEAELKRLVATKPGAAMPGHGVGRRVDSGRVWMSIPGAEQGEDGCLAVGRNAGVETGFMLLDHLAKSLGGVHVLEPFNLDSECVASD